MAREAPPRDRAALDPREFRALARAIEAASGVHLPPEKHELLATRLRPVVRELGLASFGQLCRALRDDPTGEVLARILDRATTNTTGFFRHAAQFDALAAHLREVAAARRHVRVWCAGCSTGEEAYTVALLALDLGLEGQARILATDLSRRALSRAREAVYASEATGAVPPRLRLHLQAHGDGLWRVGDRARSLVVLRQHDLRSVTPPARPNFDAVLCRNVLIYFEAAARAGAVAGLASMLRPGGLLVLGPSETGLGLGAGFERLGPAVYRRG